MRYRVGGGRQQREPVPTDEQGKPLSPRAAARHLSERITQLARGEVVPDSRRLTVGPLLDAVLLDYEVNRRGSVATARARLRILREAVGSRLAVTFTTEERQFLLDLLEWTLKEKRVEEHRTRTPSYRQYVLHQEDLVEGLLSKLRQQPT